MSSIEFQLIDVDASTGYNDRVTLSGSPSITESVTSGRTQPNHDISGSVVQAWTGSGAVATNSVYITPLNDFQGALNVSYTGVSSFTFTYDNGTGTPSDPTGQNIGIYDISFVVAPEPGTGLMLLLAAGIFSSVRRRK